MTQTILFVDEERFVHKALQRSFRKMRTEWDMRFAGSPAEALAALKTEAMDVIVTETVFSTLNGLKFLQIVRDIFPHSVRIILSGYANQEVVLKSVDLAHQYLAKPCEDDTLKATIARAFMMKELLDNDALKQVISKIDSLPSVPSLYVELMEELKSEDASIAKVGDIIAKDMGLTAKMLKLVNSAFFGLPQHIASPAKAASLLGTDLVKAIVLSAGTFDKFRKLKFLGFSLDDMWQHTMDTAACCKIIAQAAGLDRKDADIAFMAGLLHDIGKLLIAAHIPQGFTLVLRHMHQNATTMAEAEMEIIGTTHAAIGAYLLGLWGLPEPIIEAAAYHHTPGLNPAPDLHFTAIAHMADTMVNAGPDIQQTQGIIEKLDCQVLEQANLLSHLEIWREKCAEFLLSAA